MVLIFAGGLTFGLRKHLKRSAGVQNDYLTASSLTARGGVGWLTRYWAPGFGVGSLVPWPPSSVSFNALNHVSGSPPMVPSAFPVATVQNIVKWESTSAGMPSEDRILSGHRVSVVVSAHQCVHVACSIWKMAPHLSAPFSKLTSSTCKKQGEQRPPDYRGATFATKSLRHKQPRIFRIIL